MTVRHRGKEFNDDLLRPYGGTKRAVNNYCGDECEVAIVSGVPEGAGKSSHVNHILAHTYGYQSYKDQQLIKVM